jgi:lysophospholipase L1-like esterase
MIFLRKMHSVTLLNPIGALGIIPRKEQDEEEAGGILDLWGPDSVHSTSEAYEILAKNIADKVRAMLAKPAMEAPATDKKKRKAEQWSRRG